MRNKERTAERVGINSETVKLSKHITQDELLEIIDKYNHFTDVNGILVQLPLPEHINEQTILEAISPMKDVDGFHPLNVAKNLKQLTKLADILVVAVGQPELITKDYVKTGAVVIDVGINRTESGLKGDVDFNNVKSKVAAITPVPGGVGPMTIAMLMNKTYQAYCTQNDI